MKNSLMDSYLESMGLKFGGCDKLYDLSELCGKDGLVEMYHGDSVVFKVRDDCNGEVLALKFVVKDGEKVAERYHHINEVLWNVESPYLVDYRVYDNVSDRKGTMLPVVVSEWVKGMRLNQYIEAHIEDGYLLELLAYRFCQMAWWLMEQPFAHGNLQSENILVTEDGRLKLVDYDGMFVPSLRGEKAIRMGNCNFRRWRWKVEDFDERMDDFALVEMAMSLRAIAVKPELWKKYGGADKLLLDWVDYSRLPECCDVFNRILELEDEELSRLVDLFKRVCERGALDLEERKGIVIKHPRECLDYVVEKPSGKNVCEKFLFNIRFKNGCPLYFKLDRMEGSVVVCSQENYRDYEDEEFFSNDEEKAPFGEVVIPAEVVYRGRWYRVVGIEICAFVNCEKLVSVVVPNSVERIEDEAFKNCKSLQSVTIPNSVRELGSSAFEGCRALRRIVLPPYLKNFHNGMFSECASMSEIVVPRSIRVVGSNMFRKCGELERVVMEGNVTEIKDGAFKGCGSLREIVLPKSVKRIGAEAFKGCERLNELALPKDLEEIGRGAFNGCKGLKVMAWPKSVRRVEKETFKGCSGLERMILPGALECIEERAFEGCNSLKYALIFGSLGEIGAYAFKGCKQLVKLVLPDGIKRIGEGAFMGCKLLEEVDIPRSVETIGAHAFGGCAALRKVEVFVGKTQWEESSFPIGTEIVIAKTRRR